MIGWRRLLSSSLDRGAPSSDASSLSTLIPGDTADAPTAPFGESGQAALPGLGPQDPLARDILLARLRRADPRFDPEAFLRGAVQAFLAVETAWCDLDPQRSRQFLSPALWRSHRARMELYALHGRRPRLDGLAVRHAEISSVELDDDEQRITVRVRARSADYDVGAGGAVIRGDTAVGTWTADWVLSRRAGALTPEAGGVLAEHCPNCGAPLQLDGEGLCTSCRAPVLGSGLDWVVVSVERAEAEAWRRDAVLGVSMAPPAPGRRGAPTLAVLPAPSVAPGAPGAASAAAAVTATGAGGNSPEALEVLRAADPGFDPAELADLGRNAFVALRAAWGALDPAPARPYLDAAACDRLTAAFADYRERGLRRVVDDPLVSDVALESATDADGFLTARLRVTADIVDADTDAAGAIVRGDRELRHLDERLVMRRHEGARSSDSGVSMLRCPRCGAPLRATVLGHCDFCRAAVAAGGGAWALVAWGPFTDGTLEAPPPAEAGGAYMLAHSLSAPPVTQTPAEAPGVAALRAADPAFRPAEFVADARGAFYSIETAMAALDDAAVARLCGEPLRAAQLARHAALRDGHHHVVVAFLDIARAGIVAATSDADGQHVGVRFTVSGQEIERDDATGAVSRSAPAVHRWDEDWTFSRAHPHATWLVTAIAPVAASPDAAPPGGAAPPTPVPGSPR